MNNVLSLTNLIPLQYRLNLNLKIFWAFCFILIITLLGFYVFQINALISGTHQLQLHQNKMAEISELNRGLEISLAKLNYLQNITSKSEELGFERIKAIHYIQVIDGNLAAKKP
jgi:hypothetical protein